MNKLKHLFSKAFMLILSIIFQLAILFTILIRFSDYFVYFYLGSIVLSISAVLWIVNNRMNPGYKIAWIIVIFVFPIIGVIIYYLYGGKKAGKKINEILEPIYYEMQMNFLNNNQNVFKKVKLEDKHAYRQMKYIKNNCLCPVYENSTCSYYSSGEQVFDVMIDELKNAKEFIFLEYFIINEGLFWNTILNVLIEKVKEGVDVRIMYDDVGCLFTLPANYNKTLESLGIKCRIFNPFVPFSSAKLNYRDHRKMLIIDGETVFTGGINLADEYINAIARFGYWKDSVVRVKGDAVWSFIVMFLSTWNFLTGTHEDAEKYHKVLKFPPKMMPKGYVQPYSDSPLDNEDTGEAVYLNLISKATDYLYITTPYLILDNELITAICNSAKSGVDVRIITPHIPDKKLVFMMTRSFYSLLIESGVKIYEYSPGFMHAKNFVVDDMYGVVGTVNLDYRSMYLHFECGVFMYKTDSIVDIKKDFLETIEVSELITYEKSLFKNWFIRLISSILRIFAPLF